MKHFAMAALLMTAPVLAAPQSTTLLNTDKTVTGQTIVSPEHPTVIALMVTFMPGDRTVEHTHPWPHYGYVLEGTLTIVNKETGKSFDLKAGEFLVEMQNTVHYGENRGKVPVRMLIVDSVPAGTPSNTVPVLP